MSLNLISHVSDVCVYSSPVIKFEWMVLTVFFLVLHFFILSPPDWKGDNHYILVLLTYMRAFIKATYQFFFNELPGGHWMP